MAQMVYNLTTTSHVGEDSVAYAKEDSVVLDNEMTGTIERTQA